MANSPAKLQGISDGAGLDFGDAFSLTQKCLLYFLLATHKIFDEPQTMRDKVKLLSKWLLEYDGSCVVHVGAGLSTAAGIPDFRGKSGVWTKMLSSNNNNHDSGPSTEVKSEPLVKVEPEVGDSKIKPFDETQPTLGHMVLRELCRAGHIRHIVSQNVDGLFLKANFERRHISELHGNFYLDECTKCRSRFIRGTASETMRLTRSAIKCSRSTSAGSGKLCSGNLRDTILDWESPIPYNELRVATREAKRSKLHICIGTSLQLRPSKDLVCKPDVKSNKLVIINLQPTQFTNKAHLVINYYANDVLRELANELNIDIPRYDPSEDPTKNVNSIGSQWKK